MSPTLLRADGYWFFVFSREGLYEPPHIHVRKGGVVGKLWLETVAWDYTEGFTVAEQRRIVELVRASHELLLRAYRARPKR